MKSRLNLLTATFLAATALAFSISAAAQPGWGYGMGPGMGGYGMGPGPMGGHGMGPGMMGGFEHDLGAWMWGGLAGLDLSVDQRQKISKIQQSLRSKHWTLMGKMMDARFRLRELYDADKLDSAAIDQQYKEIDDVRRQMIDSSIEARNQINGILTKEQQQEWRERRAPRGPMMGGAW